MCRSARFLNYFPFLLSTPHHHHNHRTFSRGVTVSLDLVSSCCLWGHHGHGAIWNLILSSRSRTFKISTIKNMSTTSSTVSTTGTNSDLSNLAITNAKRNAAIAAVEAHIKSGQVIGIGSGTTIIYAIKRIAELTKDPINPLVNIYCVPTSFQAKNLIIQNELPLGDLDQFPEIDVTIDGADECDPEMNVIKGGGGCLLQEKIVAFASKKFVIAADFTKKSEFLGENFTSLPIEVSQVGWKVVQKTLNHKWEHFFKVKDAAVLRKAVKKMGPVVTDNGNFIIDMMIGNAFDETASLKKFDDWVHTIPGVIETGLFYNMAHAVHYGEP